VQTERVGGGGEEKGKKEDRERERERAFEEHKVLS